MTPHDAQRARIARPYPSFPTLAYTLTAAKIETDSAGHNQ